MKTILVTGGNRGIGLAIVTRLLQDHTNTCLLLGSRNVERGQEAVRDILDKLGEDVKERLTVIQLDVQSDESVTAAAKMVKTKHGSLYGLVNNAGGNQHNVRGTMDVNFHTVRRVCQAFLPLLQIDPQEQGRIVQISSGLGSLYLAKCSREVQQFMMDENVSLEDIEKRIVAPLLAIDEDTAMGAEQKAAAIAKLGLVTSAGGYSLSKICINSYTLNLAKKYPQLHINSVCPGVIVTDLTQGFVDHSGKTAEELGMWAMERSADNPALLLMGNLKDDIAGYKSGGFYAPVGRFCTFTEYNTDQRIGFDMQELV